MTKAQSISERAAFEAWVTAPPIVANIRLDHSVWPGQYREYAVQLAWEAWVASRKHTFQSVSTPSPLNNQKPSDSASRQASVSLTGNPQQIGTQSASDPSALVRNPALGQTRNHPGVEPALTRQD